MQRRRFITQVIAAFVLYVVISLILEKDYSQDVVSREITEGLVFAVIYGILIWLSQRWRKKGS